MIYHPEHYQISNRRILLRNICQSIGILVLTIVTCILFISAIWFCIDQHFNLNIIAHSFSILLGTIQVQLIYIAIISKSGQIEKVIESMQKVIENSELKYLDLR